MFKKVIFFILFFSISISATPQCAMCRAVLESGESQDAAEGINNGIVYLMVLPYILMGGLGFIIYKKFVQKR